jgi:hypothetical protein
MVYYMRKRSAPLLTTGTRKIGEDVYNKLPAAEKNYYVLFERVYIRKPNSPSQGSEAKYISETEYSKLNDVEKKFYVILDNPTDEELASVYN